MTSRSHAPPRTRGLLNLGLAAVVAAGVAAPSDPAPVQEDALTRLIKEYEAQRDMIERPLLTAYAQKLATLQDTLEKRRDPTASAVAAEIDSVQARLGIGGFARPSAGTPAPASADEKLPAAPVELLGRKAQLAGGASVTGDENSPVHFGGKDSSAQWPLPKLPPGRYRLLWRIACDVGAGATVRLSVDGQPSRTLEVVPTTVSGEALVANLGEFTAAAAPAWLRVEVLSLPGRPRKVGPSFSLGKVVVIPPGVTMPGL